MSHTVRIPGGLVGKDTETFAFNNEPYTIYGGQTFDFKSTPLSRITLYLTHMKANPKGEKAMEVLTKSTNDMVKVKQWMLCRFGGMDDTPDIDENNRIQEAEFVPCPKRGSCPMEGIGCCTVEVSPGLFLSKAEMSVASLINLPDKMIGDLLHISTDTVKTHIQNIRYKIEKASKIDAAVWATKKGII